MFAYLPNCFFTIWLQIRLWNCFYPLVHPSSYGEGGVAPLPGCPIYSDAARYTCLSQKGYGLKILIRTNIWLISTILMSMVKHCCCFLFLHSFAFRPHMSGYGPSSVRRPICCRRSILSNMHDNFHAKRSHNATLTWDVVWPQWTPTPGILQTIFTYVCIFSKLLFVQFVYKFLWSQFYKVPHGHILDKEVATVTKNRGVCDAITHTEFDFMSMVKHACCFFIVGAEGVQPNFEIPRPPDRQKSLKNIVKPYVF